MENDIPWWVWALLAIVVGGVLWCHAGRWPCLPPCPEPRESVKPIVENVDPKDVSRLSLCPIPREPTAAPRPLVEYPDSAFSFALEGPPTSPVTLPRPLLEYADRTFTVDLEEPQTSPVVLPRPLVEYADSAIVFALEEPPQELTSSAAQAEPRPLVEYADAGWSGSLSPPVGLLKERE